jgi:excisionase family DNA binding protein
MHKNDQSITPKVLTQSKNLASDLISPLEASLLLGVSVDTLSVWRCTGRYNLPFVKVGRLVKYRKKDIDTWLENRARTSGVTQ